MADVGPGQRAAGRGGSTARVAITAPSCSPLKTAHELLQWEPCDLDALRPSVPLVPSPRLLHDGPRLLACHDLAGGYHEDRWAQGCQLDAAASGASSPPAYFLRRWHALSTFVYFSHRLVTVPPVGWVNAAHTHGVPILGTLISEWDAGAAACRQLFGTLSTAEAAAAQLAAVAAHHGFDGWLVNIENAMELEHIPNLLHFLRVLTERMREVAPASRHRVIWYDAVTTEGKLQWQNTVNRLNRPFFDACDAIWVNYTWRRATPAAVRKEVGPRAADVYMGIDCFGRGTYGGGGFRCDAALRACLAQGLSAALFATAWPYEGDCGPSASPCWLERDTLFWGKIERAWEGADSSSSGGGGGSSSGGRDSRRQLGSSRSGGGGGSGCSPCIAQQLPLHSNFSVGAGRAFYQGGRPVGGPWYNLSLQARQPLLRVQLTGCTDDSSSRRGSASGASSRRRGSAGEASSGSTGTREADGGTTPWLALLQSLCGRLLRALHGWLWWKAEAPCAVQAAIVDNVAFSGGSALRVSGSLPPGQQASVQLFPAAVPLPPSGICVRLAARASGVAQFRLALRLGTAAGSADAAGSAEAAEARHADSCHGTLELLPALGLPGDATVGAEAVQAWSSGPAAHAAAASCDSAPWHAVAGAVQQSGISDTAASAGQAAADGRGEWRVWRYRLPHSALLAALPATAAGAGGGGGCAAVGEGASPAVLLGGVDLLVRSTHLEQQGSPGLELHLGEVCVEAAPLEGWPAAPAGVQQLRLSSLHLAHAPADSPTGSGTGAAEPGPQRLLSAQLEWPLPAGASPRCCHVWCWFSGGSGSSSSSSQSSEPPTPRWLGAACCNTYCIASLPVPAGATAVRLAVQPEAGSGLVQDLRRAAHVQVNLVQPGSS